MTVTIKKIEPEDLSTIDIGFLLQSVAVGKESWAEVAKEIAEGRAVVWRLTGPRTRGVMLTQVVGDLLFVWHLAGEGLWRTHKSIVRGVKEIATRNGLAGIQGQSVPTIAKLLRRQDFDTPRTVVEWRN